MLQRRDLIIVYHWVEILDLLLITTAHSYLDFYLSYNFKSSLYFPKNLCFVFFIFLFKLFYFYFLDSGKSFLYLLSFINAPQILNYCIYFLFAIILLCFTNAQQANKQAILIYTCNLCSALFRCVIQCNKTPIFTNLKSLYFFL